MKTPVLSVQNLKVSFKTDDGLVHAVRGVSFDLYQGETLCIVGESGSGKSVTSKTIMGILAASAVIEEGKVMYEGEDLTKIDEYEFHRIRGHKIGMIFQDPLSSLNPIMKVGKQITEAMLVNKDKMKAKYESLIAKEQAEYKNNRVIYASVLQKIQRDVDVSNEQYHKEIRALEKKVDEKDYELSLLDKNGPEYQNVKQEYIQLKADTKAKIAELKREKKAAAKRILEENEPVRGEALKAYRANEPILKHKLEESKKRSKEEIERYKAEQKEIHLAKVAAINSALEGLDPKAEETAVKRKEAAAQIREENERYKSLFTISKKEAKEKALKVMKEVGIPQPEIRYNQYPFEFSGGMRQRIVIAIALTANPEILICDEPTTALDVTIQAQILELINQLKKERNMSVIFISHDLGVVANMADRVAVMYAGKIVEVGTADDIFYDPKHPYTWALLSSIPDIDSHEKLEAIPGTPPYLLNPPKGDAFAARNRYALKVDFEKEPPFFKVSDTHYAATWLLDERAPKVEMPRIVAQRIKYNIMRAKKEGGENND